MKGRLQIHLLNLKRSRRVRSSTLKPLAWTLSRRPRKALALIAGSVHQSAVLVS